jgi:broad specificity phosphatase PhoE
MKFPAPNTTTHLFLVRHGATSANERQPYVLQGKGVDLPLSETGERQATAVGRLLAEFRIHQVFASPLVRARQTAAAIAAPHGLTVTTIDELHECDVGDWEGLDWDTIQQRHPEAARRFLDHPGDNPYLGGESYRDTLNRVRPVIHSLLERCDGQNIVVVAHNVVNRVYLAHLLGTDLNRAKGIPQSNGAVNFLRHHLGQTIVTSLNSILHLDEMPL